MNLNIRRRAQQARNFIHELSLTVVGITSFAFIIAFGLYFIQLCWENPVQATLTTLIALVIAALISVVTD